MIQEIHLDNKRIEYYGTLLPGNWEMFWSSTIGPNASQGGTCISIAEKLSSFIVEKKVLLPGKGQCVVFQDEDVIWELLNVYAPNHASTRENFWKDILNALLVVWHWCVAGDFNMLEDQDDRSGGSIMTIRGEELTCWERLCFTLHISDVWSM